MIGILCQAVTVVVRALTTAQYGPSQQPYQAVSTVHHVHAHERERRVRHGMGSREALYRCREGVKAVVIVCKVEALHTAFPSS